MRRLEFVIITEKGVHVRGPSVSSRPDDPWRHWKAGEIIRGSGGRNSPSGVQGQSPWWMVKGAKHPETGSGAEPQEAEQVLIIIDIFWLTSHFAHKMLHTT